MPITLSGPRKKIAAKIAEQLIPLWHHIETKKSENQMSVTFCCPTDAAFAQVVKAYNHPNGRCQYGN